MSEVSSTRKFLVIDLQDISLFRVVGQEIKVFAAENLI